MKNTKNAFSPASDTLTLDLRIRPPRPLFEPDHQHAHPVYSPDSPDFSISDAFLTPEKGESPVKIDEKLQRLEQIWNQEGNAYLDLSQHQKPYHKRLMSVGADPFNKETSASSRPESVKER